MHQPTPAIPHSVLFQAPGRPLAASRERQARQRITEQMCQAFTELGWRVGGAGVPAASWHFVAESVSPVQLGDALEAVLKQAAACLDADLIGGANVTRLDRSITCGHARLPYRKALRVANGRGWSLALGEEIPADAQATLIRFCGLLPVQVLCLPGQPRPAEFAPAGHGLLYLVPLAGEVLRADAGAAGASCRVDLDRFLQYCLGLAEPPRAEI
jgi:hypothetical protein